MSVEEDIGYIKKSIEILITSTHDNSLRLTRIETELSLYKTIVKMFKFVGLAIVFILTFKFGDVKSLWTQLFGK